MTKNYSVETATNEPKDLEGQIRLNSSNIHIILQDLRRVRLEAKDMKAEIEAANKAIKQIAADSVILGNQNYTPQYRVFSRKANRRIHELVGSPTDDAYILFQPFFRSGIYKDIADTLNISSWKQISMINYNDPSSDYNSALHMLETWKPKHGYFIKRVNDLIEKRDNGVLATERCRALTRFLRETNNATDVPFLS